MYKVGLIGYGSIGKRHLKNLLISGVKEIALLRALGNGNEFGLKEYYSPDDFFRQPFDFIILSNPTSEHHKFLVRMITTNQNIFCEKPVVGKPEEAGQISQMLSNYKGKSITAFNMRFHPCISRTAQIINEGQLGNIYSARFFVGQYLPDWRPQTDYSKSYSAIRSLGGGVTLDLVHEIDLALYLVGSPVSSIYSIADKFSNLKIETEDLTEILFRSSNGALVSIHLDYLYRGYRRNFELIGEKVNLYCDLFNNTVKIFDDKNQIILDEAFPDFQRNDMYLSLLKYYIANLTSGEVISPDLREGLISAELAVKVLTNNNLLYNE